VHSIEKYQDFRTAYLLIIMHYSLHYECRSNIQSLLPVHEQSSKSIWLEQWLIISNNSWLA